MRTLIRDAFCVTAAIPLLTVTMIQPSLGALLMTPVGRSMVSARATPWLTGLGSQEVGYFAILAA